MPQIMTVALPILTFHALDELPSVISFAPQLFKRGLRRLTENGYRTMTLIEAVEAVKRGEPFPERSFVITFDDGFESVYTQAFAVLQELNLSATVFLTVGADTTTGEDQRLPEHEGRSMLSWREIRQMQKHRIDFGAHTLTHPDLTTLSASEIEKEIGDSKKVIEDAIGVEASSFAYPFGFFDECSRAIAAQYFACACSDRLGMVNRQSDIYTLERVESYYLRREFFFDLMTTEFFSSYIWACKVPRNLRRLLRKKNATE
jgi:peptidoglycan/xylan/chitin deacetylase (PgdA/CDA1 family)